MFESPQREVICRATGHSGRTPELVALLEGGLSAGRGRGITFDGATKLEWSDLWSQAGRLKAFASRYSGAVGVLLETSPQAIAVVVGTWRAGRRVVSLPAPGRGAALDGYLAGLAAAVSAAGVEVVCVPADFVELLSGALAVPVISFDAAANGLAKAPGDAPGCELVQFTSGSTAFPKGVLLTGANVAANVAAIVDTYGFDATTGCVSWLPLSHDMGLIGGLLASMATGSDMRLSSPQRFIADPRTWLSDIAAHRPAASVLPNFALSVLAKQMQRFSSPDTLSSLRTCILGGDPVSAAVLRNFAEVAGPLGLSPSALLPAYGMAEATLAVTLSPQPWRSVVADAAELALGRLAVVDVADAYHAPLPHAGLVEVALSGAPVAMTSLGTVPAAGIAGTESSPLYISGPATSSGYVGMPSRGTEWLRTSDVGWVFDGHVLVAGRADDVIILRARKLHPADIEPHATVAGLRPGNVAAVAVAAGSPDAGYALVAELNGDTSPSVELCRQARTAATLAVGAAPSSVVLVARGTLPKTTSGKLRRALIAGQFASGELEVLARWDHPRSPR